eukprot:comp8002_c0_seq1/m.3513 comp8002_c0_seq1/g.3513  ORF comp8002_c0_seq1/g.3513 comp8002_c0_seq1/m.3513 type:complete len:185 (-) comp8002_c0_seq1:386-940(-)
MHSWTARLNALAAFAFSTLTVLTACCWMSGQFLAANNHPVTNIQVKSIRLKHGYEWSGMPYSDKALMRFKIDIDTTPLFDWSVKEVFLYLTAEYSSKANRVNQVVLWDRIVMSDTPNKRITLNNAPTKYEFYDDGKHLLGNQNVTLSLNWNIVPVAGLLPLRQGKTQALTMPEQMNSLLEFPVQ